MDALVSVLTAPAQIELSEVASCCPADGSKDWSPDTNHS